MIEDMRESYKRSQDFLQTMEREETSEEKLRESFREQLLLVAGFNQEEVDRIDLPSMSDEELQEVVRKKLLGTQKNDYTKQKVVNVDDVERYLSQGWEYIANLPNRRILIKMNS